MTVQTAWGVDPSTKRVAIAEADREQVIGVRVAEFDLKLRGGPRLADIYAETFALARSMSDPSRPMVPQMVFVEQPAAFGRQVEPQLMYAVGVIQLAIYLALEDRWPHPVAVETMPIAEWRKLAFGVGNGNAKKVRYLELMRRHGYAGDDLDECAAWGIAKAGALSLWPPQLDLAV